MKVVRTTWTCMNCGNLTDVFNEETNLDLKPPYQCKCSSKDWKRGLHQVTKKGE